MKAVVAAFNQEKPLVGAFSVIVQPVVEPMEHYTALVLVVPLAEVSGPEVAVSAALARRVAELLGHHQVLLHVADGLQTVESSDKTQDSDSVCRARRRARPGFVIQWINPI